MPVANDTEKDLERSPNHLPFRLSPICAATTVPRSLLVFWFKQPDIDEHSSPSHSLPAPTVLSRLSRLKLMVKSPTQIQKPPRVCYAVHEASDFESDDEDEHDEHPRDGRGNVP